MKILISTQFYPSTGGIETVMSLLAQEWSDMGYDLRIVTDVPASDEDNRTFPFEIIRQPNSRQLLALVDWCDVYMHANISLKAVWPLLVRRRQFVATHHSGYRRESGRLGWQDFLKLCVARRAINIACSESVARDLPVPCAVVGNPYEEEKFFVQSGVERNKDLVFVGRLVSDKGVNVLLSALSLLQEQGTTPSLTIIGDGPERPALEEQTKSANLEKQVTFVGRQPPSEVAHLLNQHQLLVVPSLWNEPFGVVALEGIACGCVAVGSAGGGLKDAIGPCGLTFPNGDATELAHQLTKVLSSSSLRNSLLVSAPQHLYQHQTPFVARRYMEVISERMKRKPLASDV